MQYGQSKSPVPEEFFAQTQSLQYRENVVKTQSLQYRALRAGAKKNVEYRENAFVMCSQIIVSVALLIFLDAGLGFREPCTIVEELSWTSFVFPSSRSPRILLSFDKEHLSCSPF